MMIDWKNRRVLILGAARQGLALARFLVQCGARVTLNDQRSAEDLKNARDGMADLEIEWMLGSHPQSLLDNCEVVCLSGGIPLSLPIVQAAVQRGLPITNDTQIFMDLVPCPVIGITGSAGKTTTTTLVGRMAQFGVQLPAKSWVGGNIGLPLIGYLDQIKPRDLVILELSSFQLEQMNRSPQISAVLNITPNHLDRHGTLEAYAAAKARILDFQSVEDVAILGSDDPGSLGLKPKVAGKLITFGMQKPSAGQVGTYAQSAGLYLHDGQNDIELMPRTDVMLRGDHNLLNILAACAIAHAAGLPVEAMQKGVEGFGGVAHRLEWVRTHNGVQWYNDSIATAPERTLAAIRSFDEPLVLLLGGRDKDLPWDVLAAEIGRRVDHVVLFGEAAGKIQAAIQSVAAERPFTLQVCRDLSSAVQAAAAAAKPGDVVLLSPGGTSYDQFRDFEERGERYREWVKQLS